MTRNPWISRLSDPPAAEARLFCFPYAGAGASAYFHWARDLAPRVAVHAVQLPGREGRLADPLVSDLDVITGAIRDAIEPMLDRPYALFGHSMGTVLAFETARLLRSRPPVRLFVSGREAPHLSHDGAPLHVLPEAEFLAETVRRYQGIPQAILDEPELVKLFVPILRADLKAIETYRHIPSAALPCPITAMHGVEDRTDPEGMRAWEAHTEKEFDYREFPGGHFFIQTARAQVLAAIREALFPRGEF